MSILADWARNDPERLLAHFRENPDHAREAQFLGEIAAKHPDLALVRVRELIPAGTPLNGMMNHQIGEALRRIAAADPARAGELLDSLPTSFARDLEVGLAEHSLKQSFADGIRALWDRPDGWDLFNSASVENKGELKHSSPHDGTRRNPATCNGPRRRNNGSRPLASSPLTTAVLRLTR